MSDEDDELYISSAFSNSLVAMGSIPSSISLILFITGGGSRDFNRCVIIKENDDETPLSIFRKKEF
jgi:hypothetical protein